MTETDPCKQVQKEGCPPEKDVSPLTPHLTMARQAWLPPRPSHLHRFKRRQQPALGVLESKVREDCPASPFSSLRLLRRDLTLPVPSFLRNWVPCGTPETFQVPKIHSSLHLAKFLSFSLNRCSVSSRKLFAINSACVPIFLQHIAQHFIL